MLGLRADASRKQVMVDPALPEWLPDVTLQGLKVGQGKVDIRFWRDGKRTRWDVVSKQGDIDVQQAPFGRFSVEPPTRASKDVGGEKAADGGTPIRKLRKRA
jgi:hypothetical protein